jgi:hypothetical protein
MVILLHMEWFNSRIAPLASCCATTPLESSNWLSRDFDLKLRPNHSKDDPDDADADENLGTRG